MLYPLTMAKSMLIRTIPYREATTHFEIWQKDTIA